MCSFNSVTNASNFFPAAGLVTTDITNGLDLSEFNTENIKICKKALV